MHHGGSVCVDTGWVGGVRVPMASTGEVRAWRVQASVLMLSCSHRLLAHRRVLQAQSSAINQPLHVFIFGSSALGSVGAAPGSRVFLVPWADWTRSHGDRQPGWQSPGGDASPDLAQYLPDLAACSSVPRFLLCQFSP